MAKTLKQWLTHLESLHHSEIELGLDRVLLVYKRLNISSQLPKVVTVAGTNGKGSTVSVIESIALNHGLSVGAYTSPHLFLYNERVRVGGIAVSDDVLVSAFEIVDSAIGDTSLTYFEFGTLASLVIFAQSGLDLVILEVGLGGRLDAVNIIDADLAVITSVDIDHTDWLGDDRESIGFEKGGIARPFKPVVCGEPNVPVSLANHLRDIDCVVYQTGVNTGIKTDQQGSKSYFYTDVHGLACSVPQSKHPQLLESNVAIGLQACVLVIPSLSVVEAEQAAASAVVTGRQQQFALGEGSNSEVIVDVGHNPHAAKALAVHINAQEKFDKVVCLVAMMSDKDISGAVDELLPYVDSWVVSGLPAVSRAATSRDIYRILQGKSLVVDGVFDEPFGALDSLVGEKGANLIVVFGSFYTAAEALAYFQRAI